MEVRGNATTRGLLAHAARATAHVAAWAACGVGVAFAQVPPIQEATSISTDAVPIERTFDVPQAGGGQYRITLTDLGALLAPPASAPLDNVHVLITRGNAVVAKLSGEEDPASPTDTRTFEATPGTYKIHIVGKPGTRIGSGPVGLQIANVATTTNLVSFTDTLAPPPTVRRSQTSYEIEIDVPATGDYELSLTDLAFPQAGDLQTAGLVLFQPGAPALAACLNIPAIPSCPSTQTVNLAAGKYQMQVGGRLVSATADGAVFSAHVQSAAGTVLHSRTVELGDVKRVSPFSFQLDTGIHTLSVKDLEFPVLLSSGKALAWRVGEAPVIADAVTPEATVTVVSDNTAYDVFSFAKPDATAGTGSYIVEVRPPTGPAVLSSIEAIGGGSAGPYYAYTFGTDIATAGAYRAKFGDFQFPAALSGARIAIVQNGAVVAKTDPATGTSLQLDATLAAGRATTIAVGRSAVLGGTLTQSGGTFGLELGPVAGGTPLLDTTQGVGGAVSVRKVSITTAGLYDLSVSDLDAPDVFSDLMVVFSRGSQRLAAVIVGNGGNNPQGGTAVLTDYDASAGNYSITLLAKPGAANAAAYGISFVASPPAPTVTLTATPTSVTSGGTVGLTWTAQGAASCTANSTPGGAWSGTKGASGTEASTAISAATKFTLRCVNANNRATERSVDVNITAAADPGGGGGGGALGGLFVVLLTLAGVARSAQRLHRKAA